MKLPHFAFFASDILKTITYKSTNKFISLLLREFPNTILGGGGGGEGGLPYNRLIGMCCWMGSHFHDCIDYLGSHFQYSYKNGVAHCLIFGIRQFFIFTVTKSTRMFAL